MDSNVIMTIHDSRDRLLVVQKRLNGKSFFVFLRYTDMLDEDKKVSKVVFETIRLNDSNMASQSGNLIRDIDKFLNFQDDGPDLCG